MKVYKNACLTILYRPHTASHALKTFNFHLEYSHLNISPIVLQQHTQLNKMIMLFKTLLPNDIRMREKNELIFFPFLVCSISGFFIVQDKVEGGEKKKKKLLQVHLAF